MAKRVGVDDPIRSELVDDPEMLELVEYFVRELPERTKAISECWREKRMSDLARLAHQMKGASGGYGFSVVSAAAERLEESLRDEAELERLQDEVDALISLCRRVTV